LHACTELTAENAMKIASASPFVLRPYAVTKLVEDEAPASALTSAGALPIGRALLKYAASGGGVVVASTASGEGAPANEIDYKKLAKGVVAIAGETLTGKAVAKSAWQLSSLSSNTTTDALAKTLVNNHIAPAKAQAMAEDALKILHDPVSRGILISISAGAATYIVVQRTTLSTGHKWAIICGAAALAGALFAILYKLQIVA
jgi:hypothetical protein